MAKLDIPKTPIKTKTISFRMTPATSKKLTHLRNENGVKTGELFEFMINYFYDKGDNNGSTDIH